MALRLLFLTPYLASPPRSGGPRRVHGLMAELARTHDVSVLAFTTPGEDATEGIAATRAYCREVVTVENDRYGLASRAKRALQLRSLASPWSFERLIHHRPAYQAALDRLLARERFDAITVEFAQMASYRLPRDVTSVLDEHNIEYDILRRTATVERALDRRVYNRLNALKLAREERAAWRRFNGCALTSPRDEALLRREGGKLPTAVVPNGVDTDYFRPTGETPESATILFFGAINYYPNTEGLLFFLDEVWPQLKRARPDARLLIVGQLPPEAIQQRAAPDVIVTGAVADVRPYLARATVSIAPLRIGGGTRLKIVEAMAMGKAIVSTTLGAEGLDVQHGRDLLLADTAEEFAGQVCRALDDTSLAQRLGTAARRLAEDRYSWRASVARLERFYGELAATRAASAPRQPEGAGAHG